MKKTTDRIRNYIQLHTSDMENGTYVETMRELSEWAASQADIAEYREETMREMEISE